MERENLDIVVESTVLQEEIVIDNELLIFDIPTHIYQQIIENRDSESSPAHICSIIPEPSDQYYGREARKRFNHAAYLCTDIETHGIHLQERNSPLYLCQRRSGKFILEMATKLAYGAKQKLIRPDFSRIAQMMHESDTFLLETLNVSDGTEPLAFTFDRYCSAAAVSRKEVDDELFCCGFRVFQPPFLQKIAPADIDPVIDSIVTQLVGIQLQHEQLDVITHVPLLPAIDALRDVYPDPILAYALETIGDIKEFQLKSSGDILKVVCLNLRGYIRHKIHYCFRETSRLQGAELWGALQEAISPEVHSYISKQAELESHHHDADCEYTLQNLFEFSETFFRGIAVCLPSFDEIQETTLVNREFIYVPFSSHQGVDSYTTLESVFQACKLIRKVDLACYIFPFFFEEPTLPLDEVGLIDDWTTESKLVRTRLNSTAGRYSGELTYDHQTYLDRLYEIDRGDKKTVGIEVNSKRETFFEKYLFKIAKENNIDGQILYGSRYRDNHV